jgi:CheY-like chemotaxis protein
MCAAGVQNEVSLRTDPGQEIQGPPRRDLLSRYPQGQMQVANSPTRARDLLIIDDDTGQVRLFQALLTELALPHRCHHALTGADALRFLRRESIYRSAPRPELIVLDINMPGMDGCAVLEKIKEDPNLRVIPVIMFSLGTGEDEVEVCYRQQANAYIQKPQDYETSLRVVREIDQFWFHTATLPGPVLVAES